MQNEQTMPPEPVAEQPETILPAVVPAFQQPLDLHPGAITYVSTRPKKRYEMTVVASVSGSAFFNEPAVILEVEDDEEVFAWAQERIRRGIVQAIPEGYSIEPSAIKQIYAKRIP